MKRVFGWTVALTLAGAFALNPAARAEDAAASTSVWDSISKNAKASYLLWITGPRSESLSGNVSGGGTSLGATHYLGLGYSLGKGYTLRLTNVVAQVIDEDDTNKPATISDPYLTLSLPPLIKLEQYAFAVSGYVRYYLPLSRSTQDGVNVGAKDDKGRGQFRIYLNPNKSFFDGALTFNFVNLFQFKFNANTPQERFDKATIQKALTGKGNLGSNVISYREDMYYVFNPSVAYAASSKLEAYVEWASLWRHTTNGKWSSVDHPSDGQYISPGVNWTPTKKVLVNPYISYQLSAVNVKDDPANGVKKGLDHFDIGVQLQYTFM